MGAKRRADGAVGRGWVWGWTLGGASVGVAAGLLVSLVVLARRIAHQAADIADGLEAVEHNTAALPALASANDHLRDAADSLRRALRSAS